MRFVPTRRVEPGMELAHDLKDARGRVIASEGNSISESLVKKLNELGVEGIYIVDELSRDIEIESAIPSELKDECIEHMKNMDVDGCRKVAKEIVFELKKKKKVSLDMADMRKFEDHTFSHSVNVAVISCVIGMGLRLREEELDNVVTAALLHDLGKLRIPEEILNKTERLTKEEYQIMKTHAQLSYDLIKDRWDLSAFIKTAVRSHHENVDGSGYPDGLEGKDLSLYTKILHVADVYDALISKRPYKEPYSPREASEYLMGACGIQFERQIVEALLKYLPLYRKGTDVILSDGRQGLVYENSGVHNLRPMIKLYNGEIIDLNERQYWNLTISDKIEDVQAVSQRKEYERLKMDSVAEKKRVLIVDDMEPNLLMMTAILEDDYEIITAKSGEKALNYLKYHRMPEVILMDIDMPEMNGIETTIRIQETYGKHVPIVFVTALSDKETVLKCRELKARAYIIRPYKATYIRSVVDGIIYGWEESY